MNLQFIKLYFGTQWNTTLSRMRMNWSQRNIRCSVTGPLPAGWGGCRSPVEALWFGLGCCSIWSLPIWDTLCAWEEQSSPSPRWSLRSPHLQQVSLLAWGRYWYPLSHFELNKHITNPIKIQSFHTINASHVLWQKLVLHLLKRPGAFLQRQDNNCCLRQPGAQPASELEGTGTGYEFPEDQQAYNIT